METEKSTNDSLPGAWDLFKPSWQAFKVNWVILIFGILVPVAAILFVIVLLQVVVHFWLSTSTSTTLSHGLIAFINILSVILGAGAIFVALPLANALYYYTKLKSAKGTQLKYWASIRASFHYFWRILGLGLFRFLIILVGLILLIVPGVYLWRRYFLAPYYLVDKDLSIGEAMRQSATDSKPFAYALWGMLGVFVLLEIVGIIPWVGWIISAVAGIAYMCAGAVRYYQIQAAK